MATTNINILTDSELKDKSFEISKSNVKYAKIGGWEDKITISDDFNEPMEEFEEYNYFTIEDIHNIRYENYKRTKNMSHKEIIEQTRKDALYGIEFLKKLKYEKDAIKKY